MPGRLQQTDVDVKDSHETELHARRRALIAEMEVQVGRAYEKQRYRNLSPSDKFVFSFVSAIDVYATLFVGRRTRKPYWTGEAFRIHDWSDVEALEKEIVATEPEGSTLRRAFGIDKDKLKRCLDELSVGTAKPQELTTGLTIAPAGSITFPFAARAPHCLRQKTFDLQFRLSMTDAATGKLTTQSISKRVVVLPSAFAVPTGAMIGAAAGYAIRQSISIGSASAFAFQWSSFGGSVLLGLLVALLTSRKANSYKVITVEDFLGGFIIGALTGLFSQAALERLRSLFTGAA